MNMVQSVLIGRHVPKIFWPKATRNPTTAVQDKTPDQAWSGIKPSVAYF